MFVTVVDLSALVRVAAMKKTNKSRRLFVVLFISDFMSRSVVGSTRFSQQQLGRGAPFVFVLAV